MYNRRILKVDWMSGLSGLLACVYPSTHQIPRVRPQPSDPGVGRRRQWASLSSQVMQGKNLRTSLGPAQVSEPIFLPP